MKVRELIAWLQAFEDQDATVEIVEHESGTGWYDQGGNARVATFDPAQHADYTDLRGNQFIKPDSPSYESRTLLLGAINT